jgi:predicted amidohydrolase YtcJ
VAPQSDSFSELTACEKWHWDRHSIKHCGVTTNESLERIARLGVVPISQERFVGELGGTLQWLLADARFEPAHRQAT